MNELEFALVPADMPLANALESIRKGTRALVVRSHQRPPLLVTAGDIMAALNDAADNRVDPLNVPLSTVIPVHMPALAPHAPPPPNGTKKGFSSSSLGAAGLAVATASITKSGYDSMFKEHDERYAIHELHHDTAVVVTASKRFAVDLATSITICRCVGDPVHTFEPRQIVNQGVCNKPHAVQVVCTRLDSGI